jgi:Hsp70 protein
VGATNLGLVAPSHAAATRRSVLTMYRHRPPEVGLPSENPTITEPGLVATGFVDRVGDPVGIVAADGSLHRGEVLLAHALRALLYTVTCRPSEGPVAVTHPAHWHPRAVEALCQALNALPEWAGGRTPLALLSDVDAVVAALQSEPGLPTRGVIAVCDFGGTGTTITLVDAANGYQPIGPAVRHADFSGELIDQVLLRHVIAELSGVAAVDSSDTFALGSLNDLRAQCRGAKERLSASTVTALTADLPGFRGDIRLTRNELVEEIRQPLSDFTGVLHETLQRNRIYPADLVAVASAGGGANIPAVTTTLSESLRVPVITTARPGLTAASGAALRAARGPADETVTSVASIPRTPGDDNRSSTLRALAWSEEDNAPDVVEFEDTGRQYGVSSARPQLEFVPAEEPPVDIAGARKARYRSLAMTAAAVVSLALVSVLAVVVHKADSTPLSATATPSISTGPSTVVAGSPAGSNTGQAQPPPAAQSVIQGPTLVTQGRPIDPPANVPPAQQPPAGVQPPAQQPPADVPTPADLQAPAPVEPPPATPAPSTTDPTTSTVPTTTSTVPPTTSTVPPTTSTVPPTTSTVPPTTSTVPPTTSTVPRPPPSTTQPAPATPTKPHGAPTTTLPGNAG